MWHYLPHTRCYVKMVDFYADEVFFIFFQETGNIQFLRMTVAYHGCNLTIYPYLTARIQGFNV